MSGRAGSVVYIPGYRKPRKKKLRFPSESVCCRRRKFTLRMVGSNPGEFTLGKFSQAKVECFICVVKRGQKKRQWAVKKETAMGCEKTREIRTDIRTSHPTRTLNIVIILWTKSIAQ